MPSFPEDFEISQQDIARAIRSFPCGSAGGPDRLRPQHLKDLVQLREDTSENQLLSALVDFCYLVLRGDTPDVVRPFFFGASGGPKQEEWRDTSYHRGWHSETSHS